MEHTDVIKRPLLTEKTTFAMNERKQYAFLVDPRASKPEIKAAVEGLYKVRVAGVRTQLRKGGGRRLKYGFVTEPLRKTALVSLHPEDTIELF
jgi:large subunit ribosomal protein L23